MWEIEESWSRIWTVSRFREKKSMYHCTSDGTPRSYEPTETRLLDCVFIEGNEYLLRSVPVSTLTRGLWLSSGKLLRTTPLLLQKFYISTPGKWRSGKPESYFCLFRRLSISPRTVGISLIWLDRWSICEGYHGWSGRGTRGDSIKRRRRQQCPHSSVEENWKRHTSRWRCKSRKRVR